MPPASRIAVISSRGSGRRRLARRRGVGGMRASGCGCRWPHLVIAIRVRPSRRLGGKSFHDGRPPPGQTVTARGCSEAARACAWIPVDTRPREVIGVGAIDSGAACVCWGGVRPGRRRSARLAVSTRRSSPRTSASSRACNAARGRIRLGQWPAVRIRGPLKSSE